MLEEYFDFLMPDDIRFQGSRIGIESVLYEYIHRAQSPEAIQAAFPTLSLEQVYAAILYYLRDKSHLDDYLTDWLEFGRQVREEQRRNPPPAIIHLRQLKEEAAAAGLPVEQYLEQKASRETREDRLVVAA